MKNYIANESGGWATSTGYIKHSFARSIHFGRVYTNGSSGKGKEADLCEALRCLGQGLHCMEVCYGNTPQILTVLMIDLRILGRIPIIANLHSASLDSEMFSHIVVRELRSMPVAITSIHWSPEPLVLLIFFILYLVKQMIILRKLKLRKWILR